MSKDRKAIIISTIIASVLLVMTTALYIITLINKGEDNSSAISLSLIIVGLAILSVVIVIYVSKRRSKLTKDLNSEFIVAYGKLEHYVSISGLSFSLASALFLPNLILGPPARTIAPRM